MYVVDWKHFHEHALVHCECPSPCNVEEYTSQSTIYKYPNYEVMRRSYPVPGKCYKI